MHNTIEGKIRSLNAGFLPGQGSGTWLRNVSRHLEDAPLHKINIVPWPDGGAVPEVQFNIAHGDDCLFLRYVVAESTFRAAYFNAGDPVYKDSCVELFISLDDDESYYNFEFNSLGTTLAAYGKDRHSRTALPEETIKKIKSQSVIRSSRGTDEEMFRWEIILMIPFEVFCHHTVRSLQNKKCRGNFHKCGDDLPVPHFVVWNDINAETPDFHLPQFFGEITFDADAGG